MKKSTIFLWIVFIILWLYGVYLYVNEPRSLQDGYYHPTFHAHEPVMIPLTDTIWNMCYDPRFMTVERGEITISQICELDSNRQHVNVRVK